MSKVEDVIKEREVAHGPYAPKADFIQGIKDVIRVTPSWSRMNGAQKESLDNIVQKMGRILYGDASLPDHWVDIAGYATLAVDEFPDE